VSIYVARVLDLITPAIIQSRVVFVSSFNFQRKSFMIFSSLSLSLFLTHTQSILQVTSTSAKFDDEVNPGAKER
jgi:hypothetical protein